MTVAADDAAVEDMMTNSRTLPVMVDNFDK